MAIETQNVSSKLADHAGFIAVKATFHADQPMSEVEQELIDLGVNGLTAREDVLKEVGSARMDIGSQIAEVAKEIRKTPEDLGL